MRSESNIDLSYRPRSYFWARERGIPLSSDIKGAERRKVYERALASGEVADLDPIISQHSLGAGDRAAMGSLHPAFMGGEYLPDTKSGEVEIARITIASTTQDVTSVYARQGKSRIRYRVVDEYGDDTLSGNNTRTSIRPLTLAELVDFFLGSWDLMEVLDMNFADSGYDPAEVKGFVVGANSSFYAEFGNVIDARIDDWLEEVRSRG